MNMDMIKYLAIGVVALLAGVLVVYFVLMKKMGKSEYMQMKKLQQGTKADSFSMDIFYQRLYLMYMRTPFIKRYLYKLRSPAFMEFAKSKGMVGIKGHRLVGGFRASCYNACPKEAVEALVACMQEFEQMHK